MTIAQLREVIKRKGLKVKNVTKLKKKYCGSYLKFPCIINIFCKHCQDFVSTRAYRQHLDLSYNNKKLVNGIFDRFEKSLQMRKEANLKILMCVFVLDVCAALVHLCQWQMNVTAAEN